MKRLLQFIFLFLVTNYSLGSTPDTNVYEFRYFEVKETTTSILFEWRVANEKNNATYILEKSIKENEWNEIKRLESVDNDSSFYDYYYSVENKIESPVEHFRLRRVSEGEDSTLEESTLIHEVLSRMKITTPPGKANKEVNVSYYSLIEIGVHITIVNKQGEIFYDEKTKAHPGENSFYLKLKKFKPDRYLVIVKDEYENKVSKGLKVY